MSDDQTYGGSAAGPKEQSGAADAKSGQDHQGDDRPKDKAAQGERDKADDEHAQEQAREEARFRNPNQSPFDDAAPLGAAEGTSRAGRRRTERRRRIDTDSQDLPWLNDNHESAVGSETWDGVPSRQPAETDTDEVLEDEWGDDGCRATITSPDGHHRWSSGHDWGDQS
jgi:hypothetical protein